MRYFSNDEKYHPEEKSLMYHLYLNNLKTTQHEHAFTSVVLHTESIIVNMNGLDL